MSHYHPLLWPKRVGSISSAARSPLLPSSTRQELLDRDPVEPLHHLGLEIGPQRADNPAGQYAARAFSQGILARFHAPHDPNDVSQGNLFRGAAQLIDPDLTASFNQAVRE